MPQPDPNDRSDRGTYLAPLGARRLADEWGYTDIPVGAAKVEPQPLTDEEHEAHVRNPSRFHDRVRRAQIIHQAREHRATLTAEQRMVEARRQAKLKHVDITGELWVIGRMLERATRGGRKQPSSAIEKLEKVEARLDGPEVLPDAA